MKSFIGLALAGIAAAIDVDTHYMEFVANYGKSMVTIEEYNFRKERWNATNTFIEEHNATDSSYELGHNHMSDWTDAEYSRLLGKKSSINNDFHQETMFDDSALPDSIDWRTKGAVTPV